MSYDSSKYIYPSSRAGAVFSGGVVDNTPNTHLAPHFSPYGINFRLDGASLVSRPGHGLFVTVDGTDYPRGITSYLRSNPTNDRIIVRQNVSGTQKLVSITEAGVATNITTGANITSDDRMSFTNIADLLYCMNGTDFGKLSGTTYTNLPIGTTNLPSSPIFGTFFAGCQWVGGTTNTAWSNQVYKSPTNNLENFTATGSDKYSFSENVTGMATVAQAIFVFTKNTISVASLGSQVETAGVVSFSFRSLQVTEGANNNACIVTVGSELYYLTPSNSINKVAVGNNVFGFETLPLSDKPYSGITTLMNSLDSDQSTAFGQYYPAENLIKWFLRTKGSTTNDICIIYDVLKEQWLRDTNKFFYDATNFRNKNYTVSQFTPTIFQDEYQYDDAGSKIDFDFYTKAFDEGEGTLRKGYWESRTDIDISSLASLTQRIYTSSNVDIYGNVLGTLADTKVIGSANIETGIGGIGTEMTGTFPVGMEGASLLTQTVFPVTILRTKGNLNIKGNSIQFRFTSSVVGSQVRIKRLGYKMEILSGLSTSLTI